MKTEVYSWRLSDDLKSNLEREARARKVPFSAILEMAVREWLDRSGPDQASDAVQNELQRRAGKYFGVIAGRNPRRAESARNTVRTRLRNRRVS
jgi:predicted transcriptional regulator